MKFWILLKESARYIARSRLLFLLMIFSLFLHYVGLSVVQQMTVSVQGLMSSLGPREGMFVSLFLSLFVGVFLSVIYGIWMVPYFHQGDRSQLTYVLPVSKWSFVCVYAVTLLFLILIEFGFMFCSLAMVFGSEALLHPKFSWNALFSCLVIEVLAVEFLLFFFATLSLGLGQISTLFVGGLAFIFLQVCGTAFRFGFDQYARESGGKLFVFYELYRVAPPLGDLIFNLKQTFSTGDFPSFHAVLWVVWFGISVLFFRRAIRYPRRNQATE